MPTVWVRVYEELNNFLPTQKQKCVFAHDVPEGTTVSRLLDDLGIPSKEVDLVLAGDVSVDLPYKIRDGERISVYPVFEAFEIGSVARIREKPLRETRFLADTTLAPLAAYLRFLGFDTRLAERALTDADLQAAEAEKRILLTRTGCAGMTRVVVVKAEEPREQLREILTSLDLYRSAARHAWDVTPTEAMQIQSQLRQEVVTRDEIGEVRLVAGVDVSFEEDDSFALAAVAVLSFPELELCDSAVARLPLRFPYVPGLLSFRETPAVLEAIAGLRRVPDLLLCDAQGFAHPRRFGMACHVGVLTGIPSIGVAKSRLLGTHSALPEERGASVPLLDAEEVIGAVVRTRTGVKPVYVSVGNRVSLATAIDYVLRCSRYRLPETTRWAHSLSESGQSAVRSRQ
jgi:deoxyribonuclease V